MKCEPRRFFKISAVVMILLISTFTGCQHYRPQLRIKKTDFKHLPAWKDDNPQQALSSFARSCVAIAKLQPNKNFSSKILQGGKVADWQNICLAIDQVDFNNPEDVRHFFESRFEPYHVYDNSKPYGLFTGYYMPTLHCTLKPNKKHQVPIYAIPDDWVKVELGIFDPKLSGKTIVGQNKNHFLIRYPERVAINNGAIAKKAKVLAWCDDKIDVAFAHVQGSAIVQLPKNKQFLIGYEGSNGRTSTLIGRYLVKNKMLSPQHASMQDIREWLLQHPDKLDSVLNQNASYVFFKKLDNVDPLGSQQVPLTPERSLAIDKKYIPFGVPIWLNTVVPEVDQPALIPFRHLLIAQDTGGAIKGIVRGDVYWGSGERAAFIAGHMKSPGEYWLLLPRIKQN